MVYIFPEMINIHPWEIVMTPWSGVGLSLQSRIPRGVYFPEIKNIHSWDFQWGTVLTPWRGVGFLFLSRIPRGVYFSRNENCALHYRLITNY